MKALAVVAVQVLLAFVVAALVMPALLAGLPALRDHAVGPAVPVLLLAVCFGLIRFVWPKRRP